MDLLDNFFAMVGRVRSGWAFYNRTFTVILQTIIKIVFYN